MVSNHAVWAGVRVEETPLTPRLAAASREEKRSLQFLELRVQSLLFPQGSAKSQPVP